ncbi:MAG: hypothetical protein AABZ39_14320 [Spirochaetota bacterium]
MRPYAVIIIVLLACGCTNESLSRKRAMIALYSEAITAAADGDSAWFASRSIDPGILTNGFRTAVRSNEFTSFAYDPEVDADRGSVIMPAAAGGYWVLAMNFDESVHRWRIIRIEKSGR